MCRIAFLNPLAPGPDDGIQGTCGVALGTGCGTGHVRIHSHSQDRRVDLSAHVALHFLGQALRRAGAHVKAR